MKSALPPWRVFETAKAVNIIRALFPLLLAAQAPAHSTLADKPAEAEIERAVPPEAAALGHHGVVVLAGDISAEGRAVNMSVVQSSKSRLLDADALERFGHVRISADLLSDRPKNIRVKVDYNGYDLDHLGLGYLCAQAVLDADWHAQVFPGDSVEKNAFTRYLQSAGLIDKRLAFAQHKERFEKAWRDTMALCRDRPQSPVLGLIILVGNGKVAPN